MMKENPESLNQAGILVVEDSSTQAAELKFILENSGYRPIVAQNGRQALELLRTEKPLLVISDIMMPEMDGFELCRRIKGNGAIKGIPVILLTALSDPEDVLRGLECGADHFITKPFDKKYLVARVRHILINADFRRDSRMDTGVKLFFKGNRYVITSERQQILDLLLSTYETAVLQNQELKAVQEKLEYSKEDLERKVEQRTAELRAEVLERKKAEDEIRRLNAELEQRVAERTAQLNGVNETLRREIAERIRAEEAQRRNKEEWERTFASVPDMIAILDNRHTILRVNDAMAKRLGRKPEECAGIPCHEVIHGSSLPPGICPHSRTLQDGTEHDEELHVETLGGFFQVTTVPLHNEKGESIGSVHIAHDITERKQAEQALREAHDELARRVEERTGQLREKEVLLKEIHHRVKNNLQVISSLVSLQADGSKDETVREVLSDVAYRVRSMALVHEKLYQSADLAHIDFSEYTRSLMSHIWRSHGSAAASISLNFDLKPVPIPVDAAVPCGLILNELAGNALKHAFKGREKGEVTVSLKENADGAICLSVADNGAGLPEGLDWRNAKSLGLRLVQMLARQLDATVEVHGGKGTCFDVVFICTPLIC